jgi:uncharacterized membrane protein
MVRRHAHQNLSGSGLIANVKKRSTIKKLMLIFCLTSCFAGMFAVSWAEYVYQELLPPGSSSSSAVGINNNGEVIGNSSSKAFLYRLGTYTIILPLGWSSSSAIDINNNGDVLGSGSGGYFIYRDGAYTLLSIKPSGWYTASVNGINDNGDLAGYGETDTIYKFTNGFIYSGGNYTIIQAGTYTRVYKINNNGAVIGWACNGTACQYARGGYLYSGGIYIGLPLDSSANDVNDSDQVVGKYYSSSGFLYSGGTYTNILPSGWSSANATGINNNGAIVGYGTLSSVMKGFLASGGTSHPTSTTTIIMPPSWLSSSAKDINDSDIIIGNGTDSTGTSKAFIAYPEAPVYYYCDDDNDGYIDSSVDGICVPSGCQPAGCQTAPGNDCNDNNAAINPGAVEVCDGVDNNCNGQIDEGLPVNTYYQDADGDGYGNPLVTIQACMPYDGYLTDSTDCNDYDATVYPGAIEVCDGVDYNCDGQVDVNCQPLNNAIDFSKAPAGSVGDIRISNGNLPSIANKEFTVEAWVKSKTSNLNGGVFHGIILRGLNCG